ncbi:hypothetical protein [Paenibacillus polymyxa]|uniref:hypothetical protein n=1 Tax=Paenibacillus polymyxa TaxID=1406 RepID=UPI0005CF32AE|nr:hypothetical protein [Paenibacillus polymyxa]KAE8557724.1 hypothetical protein BJH92_24845 [Paenibacillus polymyxa]KJD38036.1 hypothetical protein QD46_21955 [Paenibacillus polymyxa]MCJ1220278.1 hypothetical protein [Paenibacillus polymyxa]
MNTNTETIELTKNEKKSFDYGYWFGLLLFTHSKYSMVDSYLKDKKAYQFHVENQWIRTNSQTNESRPILYSDSEGKSIIESFQEDINEMNKLFANQFIVYNATLVESLLQEAFIFVFLQKPQRINYIYEQMPIEKERLGFCLNEFLEFESKEVYLQTLCSRAASICIGGKFKDALKRLEKLLKADMNHDHKKIIIELTVKRNSIVHENKEYEVTDNYFEEI